MLEIPAADARRIVLGAQGFGSPRPARPPSAAQLRRAVGRLGVVQVDAVNVLVRAQYLPLFSRLGPYRVELLDRLTYRDGALFEYLAHAASLVSTELYPLLRWRMANYEASADWTGFLARLEREKPGYVDAVLAEVDARGPLAYTDLADPGKREKVATKYADSSIAWWRWSDGKSLLDGLHETGRLAVAERRGFERRYDLVERVLPAEVLDRQTPHPEAAMRALIRFAIDALGVGTAKDIADYFRLPVATTRTHLNALAGDGEVDAARVEGWKDAAFLSPRAKPSRLDVAALVSPFDSLVWERTRTERLFGFRYRIEIYVPAPKREFGYFVLPFLLGDRLVARVDLQADRKRGVLQVHAAFAEAGVDHGEVAGALAGELRSMATWLALDDIEVSPRGTLHRELTRSLSAER